MRILVILLLCSTLSHAQFWGGQEISESDLSPWIPKFELEYQGVYHFGESESESDLNLFYSGDCLIGQVKFGYWEENTGIRKTNYSTLTNIEIDENGKFTSNQHYGEFVKYKTKTGELMMGLRIENPWTSWIESNKFEVGSRISVDLDDVFAGKFKKASLRKLDVDELEKMPTEDLRIMRNEIFARYGYLFKKGGAMEKYFKGQDWYRAQHKNVELFLTEIEKSNIEMIRKIEGKDR